MSRPDIPQPIPARPRGRPLARRCRVLAARLRAALWRCVTLYGVDFGKGFACKAGMLTAAGVGLYFVRLWLGVPLDVLIRARLGL
ncbi:hypothetical protein ABZ840_37605 [Streptomyces sp. NPDC047117]|uniref:hypothetical protein n=1 Tax=Streptomyces sp. NPDC047117 TaxID=3155379 RepID=UPI0033D93E4F